MGNAWVRGYLILGLILLILTGLALMTKQASEDRVFAALARFDPGQASIRLEEQYAREVNTAASHYDLNPTAVYYVIQIESGGRPLLVSSRGARGLMQIMPGTWRELNPESKCRGNHRPFVCEAGDDCIFSSWGNIRVGSLYLSRLLRNYNGDYVSALQAYNAGQRNVVFAPRAKYRETRRYLDAFLGFFRRFQEEQLEARLLLAARYRRLLTPFFSALCAYILIGSAFFWRRHKPSPFD